jgi:hypothetical protein
MQTVTIGTALNWSLSSRGRFIEDGTLFSASQRRRQDTFLGVVIFHNSRAAPVLGRAEVNESANNCSIVCYTCTDNKYRFGGVFNL